MCVQKVHDKLEEAATDTSFTAEERKTAGTDVVLLAESAPQWLMRRSRRSVRVCVFCYDGAPIFSVLGICRFTVLMKLTKYGEF